MLRNLPIRYSLTITLKAQVGSNRWYPNIKMLVSVCLLRLRRVHFKIKNAIPFSVV